MTDEPVEQDGEGRMSLVEHLTELRDRLIKSLVAVAVGMLVGFFLYDATFDVLIDPYCDIVKEGERCQLLQTEPLEGFSVRLRVSAYTGIAIAMPVILWQLWRFVAPGLYKKEQRYAVLFVASALPLFLLGAGLAYYTLPRALDFLDSIGGENLNPEFRPMPYFQLVTYMMLAFGIGFEFPIILVFLQLVGIVEPGSLAKYRRHAFVGIAVLVAVITPSGDPISMMALTVPMWLFYEAAILIGRLVLRRRARAAAAAPAT
ncbi:MAG: twin-arginine translocase subunit TatC [Acidimicrobiales bacterium]